MLALSQFNNAVLLRTLAITLLMPIGVANAQLTEKHRLTAKDIANAQPWSTQRQSDTSTDHPLGIQTLSVEADEKKHNTQLNQARVYQFNYNQQQSRLVLVDIDSGEVKDVKRIDSIHLPLNANEISSALGLVASNEELLQTLRNEQIRRGISAFSALHELEAKASIYEPTNKDHVCTLNRCVLLSFFDYTRTVFNTELLVNLQQSTVTSLRATQY